MPLVYLLPRVGFPWHLVPKLWNLVASPKEQHLPTDSFHGTLPPLRWLHSESGGLAPPHGRLSQHCPASGLCKFWNTFSCIQPQNPESFWRGPLLLHLFSADGFFIGIPRDGFPMNPTQASINKLLTSLQNWYRFNIWKPFRNVSLCYLASSPDVDPQQGYDHGHIS